MFKLLTGTYAYSLDESTYTGEYATREEAVKAGFEALDLEEDTDKYDVLFTALRKPYEPDYVEAANEAINELDDDYWINCGDTGGNWFPSNNEKLFTELAQAIKQTVAKHYPPSLYTVEDIEDHIRED